MSMLDALINDSSSAPIYDNSREFSEALESSQISNLIKENLKDFYLLSNKLPEVVRKKIVDTLGSESLKRTIDKAADKFIRDSEVDGSKSKFYENSQEFFSRVKDSVSSALLDSTVELFDDFKEIRDSNPDFKGSSDKSISDLANLLGSDLTRNVIDTDIHDYTDLEASNSNIPSFEGKYADEKLASISDVSESQVTIESDSRDTSDKSFEFDNPRRRLETLGDVISNNYNPETIAKNLKKPFEDLAVDCVREVVDNPLRRIMSSDSFELVTNPSLFVSQMISEVTNTLSDSIGSITKSIETPVGYVDDILNFYKTSAEDWVNNKIESVSDEVEGFIRSIYKPLTDFRDKLLSSNSLRLVKVDRDSSTLNISSVSREYYNINHDDMSMSNGMFWDLTIVPHEVNSIGPPSITDIFGCSTPNGRLPILSYSLDAGGLNPSTFEIYPGVNFSIPLGFKRPSSISLSILNLIHTSESQSYNCLTKFREDYTRHVIGDAFDDPKIIPSYLDYHYCAYEIEIKKCTSRWEVVKTWKLLGIPQISIFESGESSSSHDIQSLTFLIVGQSVSS